MGPSERARRTPWSFALRVVAHAAAWLGVSLGFAPSWAWALAPLAANPAAAEAVAVQPAAAQPLGAPAGGPAVESVDAGESLESTCSAPSEPGTASNACRVGEAPLIDRAPLSARADDSEPRAVGLSGDAGESRVAPAVVVPVSERSRVESGCHGLEVGRSCLTFGPRGWVAADRESHLSASGAPTPHSHLDALLDAHLPPVLLPEALSVLPAWIEALVPPALAGAHLGRSPLASLERPPRG